MRRFQEERALMLRRWRMELGNHTGGILDPVKSAGEEWLAPPGNACDVDCHCASGFGTMRKHRPYGCDRARCNLCHYGKWYPKARANKKQAAIRFELEAEGMLRT